MPEPISEQDLATARRVLTQCRAEVLNAAFVILTQNYGFSAKRISRAFEDVIKQLDQLDATTIPLVFEEG
ncbi:hypothetical protein D3C87_1393640 [compost metagenome]